MVLVLDNVHRLNIFGNLSTHGKSVPKPHFLDADLVGYLHFTTAISPREIVILPDIFIGCMHIYPWITIKCESKRELGKTNRQARDKCDIFPLVRHVLFECQKLSSPTSNQKSPKLGRLKIKLQVVQ